MHTDFQPAVRRLNTRTLTAVPTFAVALFKILPNPLTISYALGEKRTTGFDAYTLTRLHPYATVSLPAILAGSVCQSIQRSGWPRGCTPRDTILNETYRWQL
jgi:hypothetical protein